MKTLRHSLMLVLLIASACSWRRTPVPVLSESGSVTALVGDWDGEYSSNQTGRSGSITFQLANEKDTAYGDVIMIPRSQAVQVPTHDPSQISGTRPPIATEPLTIRFVRMEGDIVSGTLSPYNDPECGCRVITTFTGKLTSPNTIEGKYTTRGASLGHVPAEGRWKVTRSTPRATTPEE